MLLFAFVFLLDFATKVWIQKAVPLMHGWQSFPYGGISVFENFFGTSFAIVHTTNTGAAGGIFASMPYFLLIIRLGLGGFLFYQGFKKKNLLYYLIAAGALGNALDIILSGHVVDFFLFKFGSYIYPVFNVADAAICIGIVWTVLQRGKKYAPFHS